MSAGHRSAITAPLWIQVLIAFVAAGVLTFTVMAMTQGGVPSAGGKSVLTLSLMAIPLVIGDQAAWPMAWSVAFTFGVYFLSSLLVVWLLFRRCLQP